MPQKPESRLQKKIVNACLDEGAWAAKTHGSMFSAGLPDIIGVHFGIGFGLEVKTPQNKGGLTDLQRKTLIRIKRAGGVAGECRSVEQALNALKLCERKAGVRNGR